MLVDGDIQWMGNKRKVKQVYQAKKQKYKQEKRKAKAVLEWLKIEYSTR